jgi:hypothetical protein
VLIAKWVSFFVRVVSVASNYTAAITQILSLKISFLYAPTDTFSTAFALRHHLIVEWMRFSYATVAAFAVPTSQ